MSKIFYTLAMLCIGIITTQAQSLESITPGKLWAEVKGKSKACIVDYA